jgi:signal transduction histidine kinase
MATADSLDRSETPDLVAASVDRHRADIAGQVLRWLRRAGSRLARDPATKDLLLAQVTRVLDDTVAMLRDDKHAGAIRRPDLASIEIGRRCARQGIHPAESVRAGSALFETALVAVAPDLRCAPRPADSMTRFCLALQRSLARRADLVGRTYVTHVIDQIYHAHAEQRRRLSRELHDQVAHTAAVALRDLELYEAYRLADHERAGARLSAAKAHLQEAIDTIRALSTRLRRIDAHEGLQAALVRCLASAAPTVVTSVTVTGSESSLPVAVCDELFLVLREAIGNALGHAAPGTVAVEVRIGGARVDATVSDDGRGFDTEQALSAPRGTGLPSMVERTHAAGGSLHLASRAGHGTTVRVRIPLPRWPA